MVISDWAIRQAEDEKPYDSLPDWQQEEMEQANDFLDHEDNYLLLPDKYNIDVYKMMESFCTLLDDDEKQSKLLQAINGRGAFRRFKDEIIHLGVREEWFTY